MSAITNYHLAQHTPLIHFQHHQPGACLRSSEVKPKLDRFIISQFGGASKVPVDWWISYDKNKEAPVHNALNYKMRIEGVESPVFGESIRKKLQSEMRRAGNGRNANAQLLAEINSALNDPNNEAFLHDESNGIGIGESYFGNMASGDTNEKIHTYKDTVYFKDGVKLTITCFIKALRTEIQEQIILFFLLHNFGTRQSKGFGSFSVVSVDDNPVDKEPETLIKNYYKEKQETGVTLPVFELVHPGRKNPKYEDQLEWIRITYGFMKSGFNFTSMDTSPEDYFKGFALRYFYTKSPRLKNDKAFVKQVVLAGEYGPGDGGEYEEEGDDYRFVRAMLGLSDEVQWKTKSQQVRRWRYGEPTITYEHDERSEDKKIERIPSPILFSVVGSRIFILPRPIPKVIFDKDFLVQKKGYDRSRGTIKTPTETEFVLGDFLKEFARNFNDKISANPDEIKICNADNRKLEPAKYLELKLLS
jgi:hypothetical protein